ncbi:tRNA (adenosine(37)-N6)-dimethylallyltransferase MiaA [Alkalihalophilus marmarensis]|uniref:tRNA (adenosine(37)-N6)-dimethylallyltransferase MiaA n=1 Tax=Alkalihalophilus marmarensis TaxID=521377 RepID=UPI002DB7E1D0|nr:tRNA (adenosine(37)-N6)-dimethylallyltransferase MiaA [Alkalihalophilus marmarensis]MEC2073193.1 tRNA (adenosine(37)-N6)-dimethylallyltransferase MiaA [Alkalihalophilus marmarensis]
MKERLMAIVGPTAVGKTALSIHAAKAMNGEIISGDSMQIYKGMDIGTAKVTKEEQEGIPHYLIDIKEPDEPFSVAEFQELCRPLITDIIKRGKLPILVGGTGLYVNAVTHGFDFAEVPTDVPYRKKLEEEAEKNGNEALYQKLMEIDPKACEKIHPNNVRRVIRALEVNYVTGELFSEQQTEEKQESLYNLVMIGLTMDRVDLYNRINKRVDLMVEAGLFDEVKHFYDQGLRDCQSIQAIGYKEIYAYFDGLYTRDEAIEVLKQNSRRYAKRQLTWFKNKTDAAWYSVSADEPTKHYQDIVNFTVEKFLEGN